ncbi:MAG: type II secretion system pilot lipoprotein GspS-beta, partial [Thermodesulfobacteriota bacterium]
MKEKFSCPSCGVRLGAREAGEVDYKCPECRGELQEIEIAEEGSGDMLPTDSGTPSTTGRMLGLYAVMAIGALMIFFILTKSKVDQGSSGADVFETKAIERQLEKARNLNQKTPMMVDKSTRLDQVVIRDRKIIFKSTLINPEAEKRAGEEEFKKQVGQSLVARYCTNEETRKALQLGIAYGHEYFNQDGKTLFTAGITLEDC